jgi:4-aminobutyrate aminotransferase-like enzyme
MGFQVPDASHRSPHMFGAKLPATYTGKLLQDLRAHKIYLSQRGEFVRISPHLHINDHDIDRLLGVLEETVR